MARTQIRSKVGVVTTTLGLAVLLAGPTATLGLGVPTVDSATTTIQDAARTTQQTAATTVTQVETTVQSTVQTTQQVAAPQPAAPAPAPATPTKTVTRVSAPVKKATTRVARPSAPSKQVATTAARTTQQASSPSGAVRTTAAKPRTHRTATRPVAPRTQSGAGDEASSQCDVSLLALLPGGNELGALLAIACDAAGGLDLPARLGLTPQTDAFDAPSSAGPATSSSAGAPSPVRARAAGAGTHRTSAAATPATADAAAAASPGAVVAGIHAAGSGHAGAIAYVDGVNAAEITPSSHAASGGADASRHHHAWFSGQSRGTEILLALIFASLSLLAGITLWRLAVRWVIPRFA
jgi:hypothetical protein